MTTRRLAAILAADVVGFSSMMEKDEEGTLERIKKLQREVIEPKVKERGGRLVKTTGDGFLCEFGSPVEAVRCAVEVQAATKANADSDLLLRMGVNLGDIIVEPDGDIYGEGVNIAARLEQLAEPGGISISEEVHRHISSKIDRSFADRGEQQVKNIARPVRVYALSENASAEVRPKPLPLPEKPSIAVLPFTNMSGDPEQEYFADGVVEDIITALSRVKSFFVIARNSSFTYKGRAVDVRQVGRELGVRYVLEGSIRKAGNRVRITGQLVEADGGRHLWADKFEGSIEGIFELQDRVTESVVGVIEPTLRVAEIARANAKPTENLDAYDLYLRALPHHYAMTRDGLEQAQRLFGAAIEIDPHYSLAKAFLAFTLTIKAAQGWAKDTERAHAIRLAKEAIAANRDDPVTLRWAGHTIAHSGREFEMGGVALDRALTLNPNSAQIYVAAGWVQFYLGNAEAAINHFKRAMRLSPLDPEMGYILSGLAHAYQFAEKYEEALNYATRTVREMPTWLPGRLSRAAVLVHLQRLDEASHEIRAAREMNPDLTVSRFEQSLANPNPRFRSAFLAALRTAGLPE